MGLPALAIPAIVAAGGALLGQGANIAMQAGTNKKNREFAKDQYNLERQHALEDWHRNNLYNTPAMQMQRFRDAGLNPHLIYSKGNPGNAAMVRGVQKTIPPGTAPKMEPGAVSKAGLAAYQTILQGQQIKAQTNNTEMQADLIAANIAKTLAEASAAATDAEVKAATKDAAIAAAKLSNWKTSAEISNLHKRTDLTKEQTKQIQETLELNKELLESKRKLTDAQTKDLLTKNQQAVRLLTSKADYAEIEAALAAEGIMRGDSMSDRLMLEVLGEVGTMLAGGATFKAVAAALPRIIAAVKSKGKGKGITINNY